MSLFFRKKNNKNKTILQNSSSENEYINNLQIETKMQIEKFQDMTQEQIENEILAKVGINRALINNPRTREILVKSMKKTVLPEYTIEISDKIELVGKSKRIIDNQNSIEYIRNSIKNYWNIYDEAVEISKEKVDGYCKRTILKVCEKNVVIEKKCHTEGNLENEWINRNIIYTYNSDGLEIKHEESENGYWNEKDINTHYIIHREDIDKAKLILNEKSYLIDLAYYTDSYDIADLHAVIVHCGEKTEIDNLYPNFYDTESKEEHEMDVKRKISESKYSRACYTFAEKKCKEK